jgi:hypothetical protein
MGAGCVRKIRQQRPALFGKRISYFIVGMHYFDDSSNIRSGASHSDRQIECAIYCLHSDEYGTIVLK